MKIDTHLDPSLSASRSSRNAGGPGINFRELFETAKLGTQDNRASPGATLSASGEIESAHEAAVRELREYLSKTPEQRMRDAILKSMGLTEEDIKKMPPEQQAAVEAAIKEKVKEKLLEQAQNNADAAVGKLQTHASAKDLKLPML